MPVLAFIHTVAGLVPRFSTLSAEMLPGWQTVSTVDESLLSDTIARGALSDETVARLAGHVRAAAQAGADVVVVTCSTLGGAADALAKTAPVPLYRIDRGMAEAAVAAADRIGVLATLPTTLGPTADLLRSTAAAAGRHCQIETHLCEGAFAALKAGDAEGHAARVRAGHAALAETVDLVVLAQASMADALPAGTTPPTLTSPVLGMRWIAERILHGPGSAPAES